MISHLGSRSDMGVLKAREQEKGQLLRVVDVVADLKQRNIHISSF